MINHKQSKTLIILSEQNVQYTSFFTSSIRRVKIAQKWAKHDEKY